MQFLVNFDFDALFGTNIQYMLIYNLECLDTSLDIHKKKITFLPLFSVASFSRSSNFVGNLLFVIANSYQFKFNSNFATKFRLFGILKTIRSST